MKKILITIDGPAGAGKTTVSRGLADRLGYKYIDTGALYRGVALEAIARGVNYEDDEGLGKMCIALNIRLILNAKGLRLLSGENDITEHIRTPEISMMASAVSARPVVRQYLLGLQQELGRDKEAVFEGRDMGTVVFPNADAKFFLHALLEKRALRRYKEMGFKPSQSLDKVEQDLKKRDENDISRDIAPLKPAEDAVIIDSTECTVDEVLDQMLLHIKRVS